MFGVGKIAIAGAPPGAEYGASCSPSNISAQVNTGSYTSPFVSCNVVAGVGPFTFSWQVLGGILFADILTPDEQQTRVSTSGFNSERVFTIECTVTDTGNANATVTATCSFDIVFGIQP